MFSEQTTFWVGKASLRCWRKLALQQMLDNVGDFSDGVSSSLDSCRELDERSSQDSGEFLKVALYVHFSVKG